MTSTERPSPSAPDAADVPTSVLYTGAVESFIAFARTLADEQWSTPVPCLPGWTVRDVLSHVSGIPDDAFAGRMDGAPGEAWTAAQIERYRDASVEELLTRWEQQYVGFGELLDGIGEYRPPFDCHAHEHDIRGALDLAGNRDSLMVAVGSTQMGRSVGARHPVTITLDDGTTLRSPGETQHGGVSLDGISAFELFRSRLGRRSRAQVEGYAWSGADPAIAATIDAWFSFGPSAVPVIE